ncbi:MAG: DUF177 domain-containing protein [Bacteroidales bacterium]
MNPLKQYNIGFVGLSEGTHTFSYELADDFFACFEGSEVSHGKVHLDVILEKSSTMLTFNFHFHGEVEVICDRCAQPFMLPVDSDKRLFVKFGEAFSEPTDEVVIIPHTESHFDLSQYVYEFLHLSLPVRRVHPDDESGKMGCDPEQIKKLEEYTKKKTNGDGDHSQWDVLKSLKFKKH